MKRPKPMPNYMSAREYTWGIRYLLFQLLLLPSFMVMILRIIWPDIDSSILNFIFYAVNFTVVVVLLHNFMGQSTSHIWKNLDKVLFVAAIGFAVYWVSNMSLSALISKLFPGFFNVNDAAISVGTQENFLLMAIGTIVFVPTAEELLYRALLFGICRKRSRILAYAISVLVFAAIHVTGYLGVYQPLHLLLCFVQYFPAGLVLAAAYDITGNIYTPILIHTAVNFIGILSMR